MGDTRTLIVGLGKTGLSCARHLHARGEQIAITDTRENPPCLQALREELPDVALMLGGLQSSAFAVADRIVLSPGVPVSTPLVRAAIDHGVPVLGDIDLFVEAAKAPIVAITGSNGKSTVTSLVGLMAQRAGLRAGVGGNLGEPVLDLLADDAELYIIELSSFQLETTHRLPAHAATVLNLSPDHLDRYPSMEAYAAAKGRVYDEAEIAVINRDDARAAALADGHPRRIGFGLDAPSGPNDVGVAPGPEQRAWIYRGSDAWLPVAEIALSGRHNLANALAAVALGAACGLSVSAMRDALRIFRGLQHRSMLIAEAGGVRFIDDSKGTNPGATLAALTGLIPRPEEGKAVLIAGGDGKGADFTPLAAAVRRAARAVVLIGRDAPAIAAAIGDDVPVLHADDMDQAVALAVDRARPGDTVLLSPACASFDMFTDYRDRGRAFAQAVARIPQTED
jgi:UDP-N-acetylmuramoylalanine--D-glutamate ligase